MPYTAQTLITRAWYLSGIVSRNLQVPTGDQITDGLMMLNDLLNFKQIETEYLPYFSYNQAITCIPGQEVYFIPNCALIETVTFNFQDVRYSMNSQTHGQYFGSTRVNNITTLPFNWTFVREQGGGNLYLYFLPDQAYPLNIFGKFFLTDVSLDTDLTIQLDTSYIEFLRYSLANYMASEYGVLFNPESAKILESYRRKLMYMSPPDLTVNKTSVLAHGSNPVTLSSIGLYQGWVPN